MQNDFENTLCEIKLTEHGGWGWVKAKDPGGKPQGEVCCRADFTLKSFCKSQFLHKPVDFFFILVIVKDKLTDLWGS